MPTVWPFLPDFRRASYDVTREYRTEILVSRNGKEQARALRQTPRKRIEYLTAQTGDCLRDFHRSMVNAQREQLAIPNRVIYTTIVELPGGNTVLTIDPLPDWVVEGAVLMLVNGKRHSLRTVASVIGTSVTFDESDVLTWPAGSRLHPAFVGYLSSNIPGPIISPRGLNEVSVSFEVDPGSDEPEDEGSAATTLGGREVFLQRPDRWIPVRFDHVQEGSGDVDYGHGRVVRYFPVEFSTIIWEAQYTGCDYDRCDELRQFFDRMDGRRGEFYMPTFLPDLVPTSGITAAGTTVSVSGLGLEDKFDGSTVFGALALKTVDGTWITRTVSSVADVGLGATITVGAAWGQTVTQANIAMISWMPVWRFASDILTMSWRRETVANVKMSFQMIEKLAVE